ncbi:MAG: FkbM family methyltransferase [Acidobacteriaceae bacterium]
MILPFHHLIYCTTLAERFELHFKPLVPRQEDGLLILDFSQPRTVHRYANSGLEFEMTSFPEEEEAIEEYFRWYRPQPGDLVYDVGANCGVSTYVLSKLVGNGGKVIAFEPDPLNHDVLSRNIERHALTNVVVVNAAVAADRGQLRFNSEGTLGSSLATVMQRETVGSCLLVNAMTMSDAIERWGVPAFCKIDIEGAEISVLAAAREALSDNVEHLAIDTSHLRADGTTTRSEVETILRSYGYEVLSEANPLMTTWARLSRSRR